MFYVHEKCNNCGKPKISVIENTVYFECGTRCIRALDWVVTQECRILTLENQVRELLNWKEIEQECMRRGNDY